MNTVTLGRNWLEESRIRTEVVRNKKEEEKARALVKQRENLIESMELIIGQVVTAAILAAQETPTEPQHVRSGRFEFRGRNDACGTGFTIICPDYRNGNRYHDGFESNWIDSIQDFDSAIAKLSDEMQDRDEFHAERIRKDAEKASTPLRIPEIRLPAYENTALVFCESLVLRLKGGAEPTPQDRALIGMINQLSAFTEMIATQDSGDGNQPDDYDDQQDNR